MKEKKYNYQVYTPNKIAEKINLIALEKYFEGEITYEKLMSVRALDLSCGNGNLLLPFLPSSVLLLPKRPPRCPKNQWKILL
jgi:adenine-specific DNA-methyltransferase